MGKLSIRNSLLTGHEPETAIRQVRSGAKPGIIGVLSAGVQLVHYRICRTERSLRVKQELVH